MHPTAGRQAPSSEQMSVGWFMAGEGVGTPAEAKSPTGNENPENSQRIRNSVH